MTTFPNVKIALNTSECDLASELYNPCLKWAERYDRGVGYFSTGWLTYTLQGLSDFASRGGRIRLITSPIISNTDLDAIIAAQEDSEIFKRFNKALDDNVDALAKEMEKDLFNTFAWLVHDGIVELLFALPRRELNGGNFHDKFGIFYNGEEALSFTGSVNDSIQGIQNYESIKVFKTWSGSRDYVMADIERFERLWKKEDPNLKMYTVPQAIKDKIFCLRTSNRPYNLRSNSGVNDKWIHQEIAVEKFLDAENGILAMATGTGKTITAIKIMKHLLKYNKITRVIITMSGNDLLNQWMKQIREAFVDIPVYAHYDGNKGLTSFVLNPNIAILIISSEANYLLNLFNLLDRCPGDYYDDTLIIFDEVHGAGSYSRVEKLTGKVSPYRYRLGLSATPEREYDEEGNNFIETEIGPVIYTFSIEDAIRKGILCPFNYLPLNYELTDEEKRKKKKIIASFNARRTNGEAVSENDMYTQLALVNKTATMKLERFKEFVAQRPDILKKCIIFVQTREYGERLQEILLHYTDKYHTYYAEDEKSNLEAFANGRLECLLTCKKISEGIDISRVANIVLFSSDRSKLVTTQRIGRALRLDQENPNKIANVVDFVIGDNNAGDETADEARAAWLTEISRIRGEFNEK